MPCTNFCRWSTRFGKTTNRVTRLLASNSITSLYAGKRCVCSFVQHTSLISPLVGLFPAMARRHGSPRFVFFFGNVAVKFNSFNRQGRRVDRNYATGSEHWLLLGMILRFTILNHLIQVFQKNDWFTPATFPKVATTVFTMQT